LSANCSLLGGKFNLMDDQFLQQSDSYVYLLYNSRYELKGTKKY
jgi:hypothetical protein